MTWKATHYNELIGYKLERSDTTPYAVWTVIFEYPTFFIRYNGTSTVRVDK